MLKSMNEVSGHLTEWGKREGKHAQALVLFLRAAPSEWFKGYQKPTAKSLGDRLRRVLAERRDQVKADEGASGNNEEYGERETIIDDMLPEVGEKEEADRVARDETQEKEKRLLEAGEEIRNNALRRRTNRDRTTPSPSPLPRSNQTDSDDETMKMLKQDMAFRRSNEQTRMDLEQRRFVLEGTRMEREQDRFVQTQETANRKLVLEEKKAAVEMEERKQAMQERSKMIDVLSALAGKLSK